MRRFNLLVRKYILFWALLAMIIGYLAGRYNHARVESLKFLVTPLLFMMIFIMVFSTSLSSLKKLRFYMYPMIVSFGLFIISPFLANLVSNIIPDKFQYLKTGIIISSTVPPDAMLSAWTGFLEGDILLTLIIQSFTFVVWIFLVPFGFSLFFGKSSYFSLLDLIKNLFFMIVIPFLLAGFLKRIFKKYLTKELLKRVKPTLSTASGIIEIFVILISVALGADIITNNPIIIMWGFFTASFYYAVCFIVSIYIARLLKFKYDIAIPLIYENGSRNLSIAMVVAITSFKDQAILGVAACILAQFPISALFYSIIMKFFKPSLTESDISI